MIRFIELTAVDLTAERDYLDNQNISAGGRVLSFAEDDLEQPITDAANINTAVVAAMSNAPVGVYYPVMVNIGDVREFYPRKGARSGTRITYINGSARPVKEPFAEVKAKWLEALAD
jgi:hypothetical protein